MKLWIKTALAVAPVLFMLGCGTTGEVKEKGAVEGGAATEQAAPEGAPGATPSGAETGGAMGAEHMQGMEAGMAAKVDPLDDPNSLLAKRVVYFDFDKSDIKPEFRDILNAHAEYLANHADVSVTLEGHCDERGTREYNIALGERRANAVKNMLTLQGVAASQIRVISYGEERPAALGHDESAWALNRRTEIVYQR